MKQSTMQQGQQENFHFPIDGHREISESLNYPLFTFAEPSHLTNIETSESPKSD